MTAIAQVQVHAAFLTQPLTIGLANGFDGDFKLGVFDDEFLDVDGCIIWQNQIRFRRGARLERV